MAEEYIIQPSLSENATPGSAELVGWSVSNRMQMAISVKPGRFDLLYLVRCFVSVKITANQNREIAGQVIDPFMQISMLGFIATGKQSQVYR